MNRLPQWMVLLIGLVAGITLVVGGIFAITKTSVNVFAQGSDVNTSDQAPQSVVEPNAPLAVSQVLSYQGRLLTPSTGEPKADGAYEMTFSLYNVLTGGAALWTETKNVTVGNGLFIALLGDTTTLPLSIFNGQELFLGITVGDDAEATPRQRIAHSAYAMWAENAKNLAPVTGITTTALLRVTQNGAGNAIFAKSSTADPGEAAVYAETASVTGASIPNGSAAVMGRSANNFGVVGMSNTDDGVYGRSTAEYGVRAESAGLKAAIIARADGTAVSSYGIEAISISSHGVYANGALYGFYTPDRVFAGNGYVDIAEHMPAAVGVEAGDVVVIDPNRDERVIKSYKANDPAVAGVISTEPAMLIGNADSKTPLALAGRVPVKVSAENGPIRRGDLLTTSDTPGHAMRATPIEVNGVEFYAPGTIIGKAMGELDEGTGTIIVLILPQ